MVIRLKKVKSYLFRLDFSEEVASNFLITIGQVQAIKT